MKYNNRLYKDAHHAGERRCQRCYQYIMGQCVPECIGFVKSCPSTPSDKNRKQWTRASTFLGSMGRRTKKFAAWQQKSTILASMASRTYFFGSMATRIKSTFLGNMGRIKILWATWPLESTFLGSMASGKKPVAAWPLESIFLGSMARCTKTLGQHGH